MPKKVIITGASGFLGKALTRFASLQGHIVTPLHFRLGDIVDESQLAGVDVLIHCAWDMRKKMNNNVAGTLALAAQCRAQRIHFIYISSMAAHPGARSRYGCEKLEVEQAMSPEDCIIKPGTIVGNGGLFAKTCALARTLPILPVFYAGRARLQTIYIDDLCSAILHTVDARSRGAFALAFTQPVSIKDFYKQIGVLLGKQPLIISLPGNIVLAVIIALEKLGLQLPITSDNLLGLKYGTVFETRESCRELGIDPLSLDAAIQKLMHQSSSSS